MNSTPAFLLLLGVLGAFGIEDLTNDLGVQELSKANFKFSIDLYKNLIKSKENLIVSGFSVSSVLTMLLEGSRGKTAHQLLNTLNYQNLGQRSTLEGAFAKIVNSLKGDGSYDLTAANSLWIEKSFSVLENYKQKLIQVYQAEAKELDLETGHLDINAWVNEKTKGLIPSLLDEKLDIDVVMFLVNAVYFKGTWSTHFSNHTFEAHFKNNDDEGFAVDVSPSATTRMMSSESTYLYTESKELNAQVIDLPYKGEEMSLTVILPKYNLADMESRLTHQKLMDAIGDMYETKASVVIPVFKIESTLELDETLSELGASNVFSSEADLSGIHPTAKLEVTRVVQKAFISVNEEGTEAGAATGIEITNRMGSPDPILFYATHPFMFVLRHEPTNTIMFTGRYTNAAPFVDK